MPVPCENSDRRADEDLLLVGPDVGDCLAERGQKTRGRESRAPCESSSAATRNCDGLQLHAVEFLRVLGDRRIALLGDLAQDADDGPVLLAVGAGQPGGLEHLGAQLPELGLETGVGEGKKKLLERWIHISQNLKQDLARCVSAPNFGFIFEFRNSDFEIPPPICRSRRSCTRSTALWSRRYFLPWNSVTSPATLKRIGSRALPASAALASRALRRQQLVPDVADDSSREHRAQRTRSLSFSLPVVSGRLTAGN